ncbi:dehydrogenase [Pseudoroseomonas deserti]|uniref:Dehydrogenase n=1 Tax=Teichococcus deserti TaxID=1817963 RepID=A0A1V2H5F1_9PROT|nr:PQQ-binding-like beta-propeller repeat protein [Pseudoroseomonas deserti]ONG56450.1 dehydrogenase [Pseudoroseomonas deserti]
MQGRKVWTRRATLLGASGLLSGCGLLDIFGESKERLPGVRHSILAAQRTLAADDSLAGQALTLPAPAARTEWPQPGGGAAHDAGHNALGGSLREAWRSSIGTGSAYRRRITAGPVIAQSTVFAADAYGVVSAHDLASGGRRWRFDTRPEDDSTGAVGAGCAFADGTLFVATGMAELLALDPGTGKPRWRVKLPGPTRGAPTVANGRVFVPGIENQLFAVSAADGKRLWNHRAQAAAAVPLGLPGPAVSEDFLVAGFPSGELLAMRPEDGRVLWSESLAGQGRGGLGDIAGIRGLPVIHDGRVYAMGMGGTSMAVDLRSGRRLWEREIGGTETPVASGDWLFLIGANGDLIAIARETGRIRWISELNAPPEGKEKNEDPATFGTPVLAGGQIILPSSKGEALLIDVQTGKPGGRLRLPGSTTLPAAVAEGTLVFLTDGGDLVAFRGA